MQTSHVDTIIHARWIAPVSGRGAFLQDHTVVLNSGEIIAICPRQDSKCYLAKDEVYLDAHLLIPGLINLHTHAAMALMRGLADDKPLMPWLHQHIWPAEQAMVSADFVRDSSLLACAEMLKSGTTTFNDMYFYPQATADACLQAGLRANLGLVILEFPTRYASHADEYLEKGMDARDSWRDKTLISTSFAPHAPYTVSDATFEQVVTYSEQLNIGIHTHLHETQAEINESEQKYHLRPLARLANLGLLGPQVSFAHAVHLYPGEMTLLAENGCHIAHCPSSNLKLASGIAPMVECLRHRINIGLGTDGAASNNRLDMFTEMRTAALLAKGSSGDAEALPAYQALEMATINGARALGLDGKIGSIEIGKRADLTAVRMDYAEAMPVFDPVSHLVYVAGREHVSHVWVDGTLQYHSGVFRGIEPQELQAIVTKWQPRVAKYTAK
ncbi:MAG TPA: TRZ/ATZ family hydrolase [Methylophilus sp.]|nr:TRZ/ATZ family hydrolase [Methylophilus sp.]HQQ33407.1 TRZ/ATZ family hydrolase [Methylophilus sp.]